MNRTRPSQDRLTSHRGREVNCPNENSASRVKPGIVFRSRRLSKCFSGMESEYGLGDLFRRDPYENVRLPCLPGVKGGQRISSLLRFRREPPFKNRSERSMDDRVFERDQRVIA